jgi:hypothetical protein
MGLVPTAKPPVIGQFANGRNATDDFLQLASSKGGTVFGWIDSDGKLQGTLASTGVTSINGLTGTIVLAAGTNVTLVPSGNTLTINSSGTPGGANTDVQFNNNGVFGGDGNFTYNSPAGLVTIAASTTGGLSVVNLTAATAILNQNSPILALEGQVWNGSSSVLDGWLFQDIITAGPASSLVISHTGSGAVTAQISIPGMLALGSVGGASGNLNFIGSSSGSAGLTVATAAGTPNLLALPTTTPTTGQIISAVAGNPSAMVWTTPSSLGLTTTIASGTAVLGTSLIASGAKASTVTVSAPGVLATDNVMADFSVDPTSTTGYTPSASGMLTIIKFCTAGNVNFIVVNNTGASITPGAVTLDFRVVR